MAHDRPWDICTGDEQRFTSTMGGRHDECPVRDRATSTPTLHVTQLKEMRLLHAPINQSPQGEQVHCT
jgi:hypothetical protein